VCVCVCVCVRARAYVSVFVVELATVFYYLRFIMHGMTWSVLEERVSFALDRGNSLRVTAFLGWSLRFLNPYIW
jgi:hypothetical protein